VFSCSQRIVAATQLDVRAATTVPAHSFRDEYKSRRLIASGLAVDSTPDLQCSPHSPSKSLILLSGSQYFRYKSWC
ncbi:hypothetical protein ABTM71_19475, partial [Acinetobacter baumannii]